ncbi:MAG: hypothetical protein QXP61_10355, partial [Nitrososphaerales archaeon]
MDNPLHLAKMIVENQIRVIRNGSVDLRNGCVICHTIFTLANKLQASESDSADLLTQVLTDNPSLNDEFISAVEEIHMRSRMLAPHFYNRSRDDKDRYIESYFRNALTELQADISGHDVAIAIRKLILNYLSIYLAQTLGVDHHASMEEMY